MRKTRSVNLELHYGGSIALRVSELKGFLEETSESRVTW